MHANPADETLPETRRLSSAQQWRWVAIAAAVLVGALLLITLIGKLTHKEEVPPAPPPAGTLRLSKEQLAAMPTIRVGLGASGAQTMATGSITADATRSTPVLMPYAGQVVRVLADAGQVVRQSQPLLLIKTSDFVDARSSLFSAQAAYQNAQAQLVAAQRNADRQQQIYETAGGALKDYQQAKADLAAAQATARTAAAALGAARDKLAVLGKSQGEINRLEHSGQGSGIHDITTLVAPISGVVASRDVAPGQYVSQGGDKPVMTITDPSRVWIERPDGLLVARDVTTGDSANGLVTITSGLKPGEKIVTSGALFVNEAGIGE